MKIWAMKHLDSNHQYTPMMEHVIYMVDIDTGRNGQRDAANDVMPCPTSICNLTILYFTNECMNSVHL